ncbi:N-(5'-phosphoribosyl)anthranilate isomerase [uncultured Aliiroseovarius sp.]|uniref:N-(5'-phosphoribosyl)anthranilate isomerase n=1 Tax=uncultured Aliiroseovarius sp. TaxID=1658783 RepID=UPI00261E6ED8|nr:N-(5'-phosphoribosyl)anthranilate isomerase [uncultured Aliiroseovarius sp.]
MTDMTPFPRPETWLMQLFTSPAAMKGGIVRRQTCDVDSIIGRKRLLQEVARRGFHVIENAGQYIIFCNTDPVRVLA